MNEILSISIFPHRSTYFVLKKRKNSFVKKKVILDAIEI